jgi:P2-related tail formation protein
LNVPERWRSVAGMALAGGALGALLMGWLLPAGWPDGGLSLPLPGALPDLDLMAQPLLPYLLESVLVDANWHLLWPLFFLVLVAALALEGRRSFGEPALLQLLAGLAFLVAIFGFTHYFRQAVNGVTFNRALLYLVPLMVYVSFHALGRWISDGSHRGDGS